MDQRRPWLVLVVYLELDRQRYDGGGDWLAYVFRPSGRMLNAELIRLGLARSGTTPSRSSPSPPGRSALPATDAGPPDLIGVGLQSGPPTRPRPDP